MSTIVLTCPGCGKRYELSGALAGKKARCKVCSHEFSIPVPRQIAEVVKPSASSQSSSVLPPRVLLALPRLRPSLLPVHSIRMMTSTPILAGVHRLLTTTKLYLPPRAGVVRKPAGTKKKSKKSSSGSSFEDWWSIIPLGALAISLVLAILAATVKSFGMTGIYLLLVLGVVVSLIGGIWAWVNAFGRASPAGCFISCRSIRSII